MCTVTFIPVGKKRYLSSNRDENRWRAQALEPAIYSMNTGTIVYPKDGDAGGSWFAVHEKGNALILLNGAFRKHQPSPPYRKSRGLVLLELADDISPFQSFLNITLDRIEPFTVIIYSSGKLYECRWDGNHKHSLELNPEKPYIWSSSTLYTEETVAKRQKWFEQWLHKNPVPSHSEILLFHQFTGEGDAHNDLMMNRDGITFTVSITSVEMTQKDACLEYLDFKNQKRSQMHLLFTSETIEH